MWKKLKEQWRDFRKGKPGQRFRERYERNEKQRAGRSRFTRLLKPIAAVMLLVAGVVLCFIPGPGIPLILIGAGLLADVSCRVARMLDRAELRVRQWASAARHWWEEHGRTAKKGA